jgi:predicted ATPase
VGGAADVTIDIRLLGPVEARANGSVLPLGGPRQRALLALLLLEPGRAVSADRLSEELWQGAPPPAAAKTLRSYLSRLRAALGRDAVEARAGGYALAVEPEQVDTCRFERLVREGREALARGAAGLAAERLQTALGLWRGSALGDVADVRSLAHEARRLEELRLACLEERIEAHLELGRHAALVPELQRLVQEDPLRERLWRQLVLALYRSGRQAEALETYRDAQRLLDAQLGLDPTPELRELERAILRHEIEQVAPPELRHNVPAATTTLVGRERELADVRELLHEQRLVTLTGIGGSGKTRLALETATLQAGLWAAGTWLVELSAIADPSGVARALAATLGVRDESHESVADALIEHVRGFELLLVLDNCEHLAASCADVVESVLRRCPNVRVLATSRVPLGVLGEFEYTVDPLPAAESVQLFLERARAVRRDLAADDGTLEAVAGICRGLEGLPLAIELAAARAKVLSLEQIGERLGDRFRFLRAWKRVADPRHQTLRATMDWSYELLSADEQALLRRFAVFSGGALLDAVAQVCLEGDAELAVELLGRLVDASLVRAEGQEPRRYEVLETVREYAAERFELDPDAQAVRRRHAQHYLDVAEAANLSIESIGRGPQRHELVLPEQHNIRAAIDWATEADVELGVRLALALENFWVTQALHEGRQRFERLLARAGDDLDLLLRARATRDYGACLDVLQDVPRARSAYERSRALFEQAGDALGVAYLDYRLGIIAVLGDDDRARARRMWERSLETFRRAGDPIGELQLLADLGVFEIHEGDATRGLQMIETSIAMAREAGWVWWEAHYSRALAAVAVESGRFDEAEAYARRSLALARPTGNRQDLVYTLAILARAAACRGERERALALWATVETIEEPPGRWGRFDRAAYAAAIPDLPRPEPLSLDDAVELALCD